MKHKCCSDSAPWLRRRQRFIVSCTDKQSTPMLPWLSSKARGRQAEAGSPEPAAPCPHAAPAHAITKQELGGKQGATRCHPDPQERPSLPLQAMGCSVLPWACVSPPAPTHLPDQAQSSHLVLSKAQMRVTAPEDFNSLRPVLKEGGWCSFTALEPTAWPSIT